LLLEQRATGYGWPIDSSGSAVKVVTSSNKLASSSHTSVGKFYKHLNALSTKYVCIWSSYKAHFVDTLIV